MTLLEHVQQVATYLGEGWSAVQKHEQSVTLRHTDGRQIHVYLNTYPKDRLEITGYWLKDEHNSDYISYHENPPKITVAPDRPAQAIAKDMQRRFMPEFNRLWQDSLARKESAEKYLAAQADAVRQLADVMGIKPHENKVSIPYNHGNHYGDFEANGYSIKLEVRSMRLPLALALARVLAENRKEE
jgi:hypothetical protein